MLGRMEYDSKREKADAKEVEDAREDIERCRGRRTIPRKKKEEYRRWRRTLRRN